ncbi:MAG: hypothetical protein GY862_12540 [Gammaproteobacteria bacterium]|nr:hypothetical protein [Gammaproteobacteria bacterium]
MDVPLYGGGFSGTLADMPIDKLLRACGMTKSDALNISLSNISGAWAVGDWVKNDTAIFGYIAGVDDVDGTKILLVHTVTPAEAPADTEAVSFQSGGTATVSAIPRNAYAYRYTSKCSETANLAVKWYYGDILCVAYGARGTWSLNIESGKSAKMKIELTGLYIVPERKPRNHAQSRS